LYGGSDDLLQKLQGIQDAAAQPVSSITFTSLRYYASSIDDCMYTVIATMNVYVEVPERFGASVGYLAVDSVLVSSVGRQTYGI